MMSSARIAIIFWHVGIGGVGSRLRSLGSHLNGTKVRHRFFLKSPASATSLIKKYAVFFTNKTSLGRQYMFLSWLLLQLWQWQPTSILAFFNRFGLVAVVYKLLARLAGRNCKVVINQSVVTSEYLQQYEAWYWHYLVIGIFWLSDKIVVNSQAVKADLVSHYRVPQQKIVLIPSWVDMKKNSSSTKKKYNAIFVGRLSPEKGIETVLKTAEYCCRKIPTFSLLIVGDGPLRPWLEKELQKRELTNMVHYIGYHADPRHYIAQAELLLLPSYNEGLPMSILESYSVGTPVAVTPFKGAREAVEHERTGIVVTRNQYPNQVYRLLVDEKKLKIMKKLAREKVKRDYSMKNLDKFVSILVQE